MIDIVWTAAEVQRKVSYTLGEQTAVTDDMTAQSRCYRAGGVQIRLDTTFFDNTYNPQALWKAYMIMLSHIV